MRLSTLDVAVLIVYFVAMIDPRALGFDLEVFLHLRVDLAVLEQTALALAALSAIRYVSATTGYSDLVCEAIFRDAGALYEFVTHTLGKLEGIRNVDVDVVLASVKRGFHYPLFGSRSTSILEPSAEHMGRQSQLPTEQC